MEHTLAVAQQVGSQGSGKEMSRTPEEGGLSRGRKKYDPAQDPKSKQVGAGRLTGIRSVVFYHNG